jgi:hypothetical protein
MSSNHGTYGRSPRYIACRMSFFSLQRNGLATRRLTSLEMMKNGSAKEAVEHKAYGMYGKFFLILLHEPYCSMHVPGRTGWSVNNSRGSVGEGGLYVASQAEAH